MQGDNLFQLLGTRLAPDAGAYMLMAACVMLPTVWLPDLKALSYLGYFGVGATITVLCAVAYTFLSGSPASATHMWHCSRECLLALVGSRPSACRCTQVCHRELMLPWLQPQHPCNVGDSAAPLGCSSMRPLV